MRGMNGKMERETGIYGFLLRLTKIVHFSCIVVSFLLCWNRYYRMPGSNAAAYSGLIAFFYASVYYLLGRIYKAYDLGYARVMDLLYSHALTACICACVAYVANWLVALKYRNPLPLTTKRIMS